MRTRVKFVLVILVVSLGAVPLLAQTPSELDATARARIEEARNSMVVVKAENEPPQRVSQAFGILIRSDLVATDAGVLSKGSRISVTGATNQRTLRVLSPGHYFLPYVLLEKQSEIAPVRLGDSEAIAVNDTVYMFDDDGAIAAGTVTGKTTLNRDPVFLISLAITSNNKGAPIFNRNGDVIGIAAENRNGGAGMALPSSLLAKLTHLGEPGVGV